MNLGVIVGRFQVPELHQGHVELINHVKSQHGQVLALLGCTTVLGSRNNPLDFITREKMLKSRFPEVTVLPIYDQASDQKWSDNLDSLVKSIAPVGKVVLYGGRDSFIPYYHGKYPTVEIELNMNDSGTRVRETAANKICVSADFRAGVIYAVNNQFPRVFPTVDVAPIKDGHILLGRKPNEGLFRFPGGFVDQGDESLEIAALREMQEETNLTCWLGDLEYVCSKHVSDWRYRKKEDGSIITTLFACLAPLNGAKAGDDLAEVKWFDLKSIGEMQIYSGHQAMMEELIKWTKMKGIIK